MAHTIITTSDSGWGPSKGTDDEVAIGCADCDWTPSSTWIGNANAEARNHVACTFDGQPFATETLVTDTVAYDVVKSTAKTITVRRRRDTEVVAQQLLGGPFPITTRATESVLDAETKVLRLRKDGTFRTADWANPLKFSETEPTTRVDYRM